MTAPEADRKEKTEAGERMVSSDDARRSFAQLLADAGHKGERVVITLYNREHAALIGMKDLERLRALDAAEATSAATSAAA